MKKPFLIFIIIVCSIAIIVMLNYLYKESKKPDIREMLKIENLVEDRDSMIAMHREYIKGLKHLKYAVKSIGDKTTAKINAARNFKKTADLYKEHELWDLALKNYEIGLEVFPEDARLNYGLGLCYANLGAKFYEKSKEYWELAEKHYALAIQYDKEYAEPYYAITIIYLNWYENKIDQTKLPKALAAINSYLSLIKQDINAYFTRARVLYLMNQKMAALDSYRTVLKLAREESNDYKSAMKNIKQIQQEMNEK